MASRCTELQVRAGGEQDLQELTDLYNHYVRETPITFDTEPFTAGQRRPWLLSHPQDGPHRLLVAVEGGPGNNGGRILGYATSSPFRPKPAYATSAEVTVYCAPGAGGRGVGTRLYTELFRVLEGEDLRRAYAGVTLPNAASVRLHERFGFNRVGTFHEAGRKFGRYWDVAWFERRLGTGGAA
ncbi:N-acetyltransferase [Streptomyces sp. F63]|uniref:GNAT family N-acetyltransferase n=1 Tax=Streptomyces sp. F63 TaxID=2824887 RepID=UPI001B38869A|nr:GNAT family N-acetyltransferase [Streptomyces sp. F63]MBQ0986335.1 N-acetyltransferase [Streptomyces sp. F63]